VAHLTVWAPQAARVEAHLEGRAQPLVAGTGGWWHLDEDVPPLTDYRFAVDGLEPRPDPRSPWQPAGPDGPSRTYDHGAFPWTDAGWRGVHLPSAVLYELHVGTFSAAGTFDGVIDHLDHLVGLGVDAVELLPVAEASGSRGWGYDGVDLYAPHHAYGGPDGLKALVDACHARGIGVVMDVVYNHLGPAGNYLSTFGPYFSERHHTNWGAGVNVDGPDSGEVRRFFIDNALMWLRDFHCDGLRLDAVHAIADESAVHLLEQLGAEVRDLAAEVRRPLFVVAESDLNDPRFVRPVLAGGYGLDGSWADEFHHAIHAALTGETNGYYEDFGSLAQVATALRRAWVYAGEWSEHRRRVHGRPPDGLPSSAFCTCIQNHDQVGNRAAGERLSHLVSPGRAAIAAALLLCSPFVPLLFQGEEWAASSPFQYFTDHQDPELGRAVTEGRTHEFSSFGWAPEDVPDPQDPATFARSKLDWSELDAPGHAEVLAWYRSLIALRRARPELTDQDPARVSVEVGDGTLLVRRGATAVAVNLSGGPASFAVGTAAEVVHAWPRSAIEPPGTVEVAADGVVILDVSGAGR
jgi:maltooligosyltrehalose trehalohydrolase